MIVRHYDARTPEGFAAIRRALTPPFIGDAIAITGYDPSHTSLVVLSRLHGVVQADRAATGPSRRVISWPLCVGAWWFCGQREGNVGLRPVYRWGWL